jgi:hypothetical protein
MQSLNEPLGQRLGVLSVDPLLLSCSFLLAESGRTRVPIVDLARKPRSNFAFYFFDLNEPALFDFGEVGGNQLSYGIAARPILYAGRQPRRRDRLLN